MAKRTDIPNEQSYSSTVRKILITNNGSEVTTTNPLSIESQISSTYEHISTATTTVCKVGAGTLHGIAINNPSASTLTMYDNTTTGGTVIGSLVVTTKVTSPFFMAYNLSFSNGLTILTDTISDYTIIYE